MKKICPVVAVLMVFLSFIFPYSSAAVELSTGKTIYVPVYRAFYHGYGSSKDAYSLTTTVSLHNTDPKQAISVYAVEHYD